MPIPRDEFDKAFDDTGYRILKFLTAHPEQAFTVDEVAHEVEGWDPLQDTGDAFLQILAAVFTIGSVLDDLVRQGFVVKKAVSGTAYYSIQQG